MWQLLKNHSSGELWNDIQKRKVSHNYIVFDRSGGSLEKKNYYKNNDLDDIHCVRYNRAVFANMDAINQGL